MPFLDLYFDNLARYWWLLALRGAAAIIFGIFAYVWPEMTVVAMMVIFGVYAIIDGVAAIAAAWQCRWWGMIAVGVLSIIAGIIAFVWPGLTAFILIEVIAIWAIVRGVVEIVAAVQLRRAIENEWILAVGGALSVIFGAMLFAWPAAGILSVTWLIGTFAILFGLLACATAFRLRAIGRGDSSPQGAARPMA
jgi:uncharacterized membrane protein HdeD (DUF308 family)